MAELEAQGTSTEMFFEVHPSVLFKLGSDLIRDEGQALAELIKNSYDADAKVVRVTVDTDGWYDRAGRSISGAQESLEGAVRGRIVVSDDGSGMTSKSIHDGWLTISSSPKLELKRSGGRTLRGRTPLGDKGLGRLGVQRLGEIVAVKTVPRSSTGTLQEDASMLGDTQLGVVIDWSRFDAAPTLGAVPIEVEELTTEERPSGTSIGILGLRNLAYWKGTVATLQREIASIVSPYDDANGVSVYVEIDGRTIDIQRRARALLESAPVSIQFRYDDGLLTVETSTRVSVLSGKTAERRYFYQREVLPDNGFAFTEWLLNKRPKLASKLGARSGDDLHFLKTSVTRSLAEEAPSGVVVSDPGAFRGELGSISLEDLSESTTSVLDSKAEFKDFAKAMSGIKVYRDGFGIRLDDDWLGLSKQQTSAGSWYGLRPGNTVGYVSLTAQDNGGLEETSSREDFTDTPALRAFTALMNFVVFHVRETQDLVRRGWNEYCAQLQAPVEVKQMESPRQIVKHIGHDLDVKVNSAAVESRAKSIVQSLAAAKERVTEARTAATSSVWSDSKVAASLDTAVSQIQSNLSELEELLAQIQLTKHAEEEVRGSLRHLSAKLDATEDQLTSAWESVALGLSAETLGHEVANISERLRGRSTQILQYLRSKEVVDTRSTAFAEEVRATSAELERQAGRLDPMLRHRRERREVRAVSELVERALAYHQVRWEREGITSALMVDSDFRLRFSPGKFSQVVDNLALNSEYWLRRWISQGRIQSGLVEFTVDAPRLLVRDNGPGISLSVADSIFDPFVTSKPAGEGRGLGLFIVRQLLDSEGATIELMDHINEEGNFDTFVVDFSGSDRVQRGAV